MKRSIEVSMLVTYGNGDEQLVKVMKIPVPNYITKIRNADKKDSELEDHAKYLEGWLKKAIHRQSTEDDRYYDGSW